MKDHDISSAPRRKKWALKFGMIESFLLIFILFTGAELYLNYTESIASARKQADRLFALTSKNIQIEFEDIDDIVTLLLNNSRTYRKSGMLDRADVQTVNIRFLSYMQQYPFISSINFGDAAGNGYLILHNGEQWRNRIKKAAEKGFVTWLELNAEGKVLSTERRSDDYDPRTQPWYLDSAGRDGIIWSAPYLFRTTRDVGITASMRLGDGKGGSEVIGVDIMLKDMSRQLAALVEGISGMTAHLLTVDGTVIACSGVEKFSSSLRQDGAMLARIGSGHYPLSAKALQMRTSNTPSWSFRSGNKRFLASLASVSFSPHSTFQLLLTVPEESIGGNFARDAQWRGAFVLLLATALGAWYFARYLLPLRRISASIREFGADAAKILPMDTTRKDEIGELATEFTQMAVSLQEQKKFTTNLIESSAAATFVIDQHHRVIFWNKACEKLTGIGAAAMVGTSDHWRAFYDYERPCLCDIVLDGNKDDNADLYAEYAQSTLALNGLHAEGWYPDLNGCDRYITFDAAPVYDSGGTLFSAIETLQDITAQKRTDELIHVRESQQRAILDNIPDIAWVKDAESRFLAVNEPFARVCGRNRDELPGLTDLDIWPEDLARQYRADDCAVMASLRSKRVEEPLLDAEGRMTWIETIKSPMIDKAGRITGTVGIARDITEHKRIEEALRENAERLSVIMDGINALIYVADLETYEILFVNKYGRDIWGEIAGKICWKTLQAGQSCPCTFCTNDRLLNADGAPTGVYAWEFQNTLTGNWYECRDQAIRWNDGRLVRMEIATDITERKKAETDLLLLSAALQASANSIAITDLNGTIVWINPAFSLLTGYSAAEAIGRNPRELVKSGLHDHAFYQQLWDTLLAGKVWRGEVMNRHKDGTLYPEGQTITPVKDARGEIKHFIAIKRDLSEQRTLEEQLRQSQKMESIGTLAGGVAHDFNNILTAIIGYGQMTLMKMPADDPLRQNVAHMLEGADRAARLTQELLLFSRKQAIDKKPLDLNTVVEKVEKFLSKVIGEDIACRTVLHEARLPVLADGYQLEQVLMNLATNARDAMPQGGTLTVSTGIAHLDGGFVAAHGFGRPGPYALLTVADTGAGMDEATRQRIFEPFFTTKEVGKGTGLGLAVVYGIVKQHDSFITVESKPDQGTTFKVYLPLLAPDAEEKGAAHQEEEPVGGGETILLAEDDDAVMRMTSRLLAEFGYTVIEAVDGADAVRKFRENSGAIDLLLFDLIMPTMNGSEAFDEIRTIRPAIKVIFSSGYAPDTIRLKTSLADGAHIIVKPTSPQELLRKVREVLDGVS